VVGSEGSPSGVVISQSSLAAPAAAMGLDDGAANEPREGISISVERGSGERVLQRESTAGVGGGGVHLQAKTPGPADRAARTEGKPQESSSTTTDAFAHGVGAGGGASVGGGGGGGSGDAAADWAPGRGTALLGRAGKQEMLRRRKVEEGRDHSSTNQTQAGVGGAPQPASPMWEENQRRMVDSLVGIESPTSEEGWGKFSPFSRQVTRQREGVGGEGGRRVGAFGCVASRFFDMAAVCGSQDRRCRG